MIEDKFNYSINVTCKEEKKFSFNFLKAHFFKLLNKKTENVFDFSNISYDTK